MHEESIRTFLKLEGFLIERIVSESDCTFVYCRARSRGMWLADEYSTQINTQRIRHIRHSVLDTTLVMLVVTQRKFYFPLQKKRIWEVLPGIAKFKQTSQEFRLQTALALRDTNFSGVARKRKTSIMFPLRLLDTLPDEVWCTPSTKLVRVGLDGKGVRKHQQLFTLTNLDTKTLLGVLPQLSQEELIQELKRRLPEAVRLQVKEVCIDMDMFFERVIHEVFPHARIVTDHFHVIAWGIHLLDQQKRTLQQVNHSLFQIKRLLAQPAHRLSQKEFQRLTTVFERFPELKVSWKIIQQLRKVYWQNSYIEARAQLRKTIWYCEQSHIPEMIQLAKTLRKWFDTILNYYLSKSTNALTEGMHTKFELIKRQHFGIRNITRFAKRLFYTVLPLSLVLPYFVQSC